MVTGNAGRDRAVQRQDWMAG